MRVTGLILGVEIALNWIATRDIKALSKRIAAVMLTKSKSITAAALNS